MNKIITTVFFVVCLGFLSNSLQAQLSCNGSVYVSFDQTCQIDFNTLNFADMFLEGAPCTSCTYELRLYESAADFANNNPLPENILGPEHIGLQMSYAIEDLNTGNICWGELLPEDKLAPIAICEANLSVNVYPGGEATVFAEAFDQESYDGCGTISSLLLRRMIPSNCVLDNSFDFEPSITFTCCEAGTDVAVELMLSDESGNTTSCLTTVTVEENEPLLPVIFAPADISVSCDADLTALDIPNINQSGAGVALYKILTDNAPIGAYGDEDELVFLGNYVDGAVACSNEIAYVQDDESNLDACQNGTILRTFFIGNISDSQLITLEGGVGGEPVITWPADQSICTTDDAVAEPTIVDGLCDLTALSYADEVFTTNNLLEKVVRTWTVINWCTFDTDTNTGVWTHEQVLTYDPDACADCILICNAEINISLDATCEFAATDTGIFLEGNSCANTSLVLNLLSDGAAVPNNTLTEAHIGTAIGYTVTAPNGNTCWGTINLVVGACENGGNNGNPNITWPPNELICESTDLPSEPLITNDPDDCYAMTYTDEIFQANGVLEKVVRTWTVIDWCTGDIWTYSQILTYDTSVCNSGDCVLACNGHVNISLNSLYCDFYISDDMIADIFLEGNACPNGDLSLAMSVGNTIISDNTLRAEHIGSTVNYTVQDAITGNSCWGSLSIEDKTPPVVICLNDMIIVPPSGTGDIKIWASDLDVGSYDLCGDITLSVRRINQDCEGNASDFAESIDLLCCDTNSSLDVELMAIDESGNTNSCYTSIIINGDVGGVTSFVPTDVTINCDQTLADIPLVDLSADPTNGIATYYVSIDNEPIGEYGTEDKLELEGYYSGTIMDCAFGTITDVTKIYIVDDVFEGNNCGEGAVTRTYQLATLGGSTMDLTQHITVETGVSTPTVDWPADVTVCYQLGAPYTEPIVQGALCTATAMTYEDTVIEVATNVTKILRSWTVLDWCAGTAWEHTQLIQLDESNCACINEDCVWPGDANADGLADQFDILHIGMVFGETGPVRPDATTAWEAQAAPDWTGAFMDGLNHKHADCDGDGSISFDDLTPLVDNWGSTHNFTSEEDQFFVKNTASFDLYVQQDTFQAGDAVAIPIILENIETDVTEVYGIAFSVHYESDKVVSSTAKIATAVSWLGTEGDDLISVQKDFWNEGRIDVGITRTDGKNISGQGQICELEIIIEDVIFMNHFNLDGLVSMEFSIDNIKMINKDGAEIPVASTMTTCKVDTTPTGLESIETGAIQVYPNPASNELVIDYPMNAVSAIRLTNLNGQEVLAVPALHSGQRIDIADLRDGLYILAITIGKETYFTKLTVF